MTEAKNFTWALQVNGERLDLEDAKALFGADSDPTINTLDDGDGNLVTFLFSPQLDSLTDAAVDGVAKRLLDIVNGVLFVLEPGRIPLNAGPVRKRNDNEKWDLIFIPSVARAIGRSRARAVGEAIVNGKPSPQHTRPPAALQWLAAAQSDELIADVFRYLSGEPDWFDFWKAFERMRDDINERAGGRYQEIGWPKKQDLDHWTLSVQVYRHAPPWNGDYTPEKAMRIEEATRFIQSLAAKWLAWRFPAT